MFHRVLVLFCWIILSSVRLQAQQHKLMRQSMTAALHLFAWSHKISNEIQCFMQSYDAAVKAKRVHGGKGNTAPFKRRPHARES